MRRAFTATLGLVALGAAWFGPMHAMALGPFSAHMAMHMGVVAIAAPLLALAISDSDLDPVPRAPRLFAAIPASVLELFAVWVWHAPVLHHVARHTTGGLVAEQATFLASSLLVWLAALGGDARAGGTRTGAGIVALLLTSMHMTLLGALLALAPRPLYAHAGHRSAMAPLEDQHLGGAIMLVVGGVAYLVGGLGLAAALLRGRSTPAPGGCRP
jgi:putative membrane protein